MIEEFPPSRPSTVSCAAFAEGGAAAIGIYNFALGAGEDNGWATLARCVGLALIAFFWVRGIYRGRRWTRLLTLWVAGVGLFFLIAYLFVEGPLDLLRTIQSALKVISFGCLLTPSARHWFLPRPRAA